MKRIRRVLHATDFSKASERALSEAVDLAKQNNAELVVVHVIAPVVPYASGEEFDPEPYTRLEEATKEDAEASMRKLTQKLQKSNVNVRSLLLSGTADKQIVRAAKSKKADLIVIGTHGRTGLSKLFMGSVAGKVVSTAECPVLTVRGR
jgi:nucleotide-binding universal stress UspA family protein